MLSATAGCSDLDMGTPGAKFDVSNRCESGIEFSIVDRGHEPIRGDWVPLDGRESTPTSGLDRPVTDPVLYIRAAEGAPEMSYTIASSEVVIEDEMCP